MDGRVKPGHDGRYNVTARFLQLTSNCELDQYFNP
jgi:hypothetical protein